MKKDFSLPDFTSIPNASSALESDKRDIKYIAGFVTFRCIKKFVSSPELNKYLEKFIDKD